jgi:hypothetical protein
MKHDFVLINETFTNYRIRHLKKHQASRRSLLLAIGTVQTQHKTLVRCRPAKKLLDTAATNGEIH